MLRTGSDRLMLRPLNEFGLSLVMEIGSLAELIEFGFASTAYQ
jgi:hypothetical protein